MQCIVQLRQAMSYKQRSNMVVMLMISNGNEHKCIY